MVFPFLVLMVICFIKADFFDNFGRGPSKKHPCKIILKSAYWPRRRCRLKAFLYF